MAVSANWAYTHNLFAASNPWGCPCAWFQDPRWSEPILSRDNYPGTGKE